MVKAKHKFWKVTLTDGAGNAFEGIGKTKAAATTNAKKLADRRRGRSNDLTEAGALEFTSAHKPRALK